MFLIHRRLVGLCTALVLAGCGSPGPSRTDARDRATTASCDWYAKCGQIAAGAKYATRDSCEVDVRASWEQAWPPASCDGKINSGQLDICITAIIVTDCTNGLDILNTLANKCPQAKICAPSSTAPDGG